MIEQYLLPELMVLVPVLIIIGMMLKKTDDVKDWAIPIILGAIGIALSVALVGMAEGFTAATVVTGIIQGVLSAGSAVYVHQLTIQTGRKRDQD